MSERKIGGHVSAAGGVDKAIERAAGIGANCVQVFSGSPRVWAKPAIEKIPFDKISSKMDELHVNPIIIHAIYLTNIASENPELVRKTIDSLVYDLTVDSMWHGAGVVVHLGSHQGRGWEAVKEAVAERVSEVLAKSPAGSTLLIENSAGQQGKLCSNLEEVRWLMDQVQSDRLGWCADTCHSFAAGCWLGEARPETANLQLAEEIDRWHLWDELKCIHVNDSRDPFGSGRDRHANIGEGEITMEDLKNFLMLPKIKHVPLILEVPGKDKEGPDAENINRLKTLLGEWSGTIHP